MKVIRNGMTLALVVLAVGVFHACGADPVAAGQDSDPTCIWVNGVLVCSR